MTVTTLDDSGPGTLRAAMVQAQIDGTADVINFAPGLTGTITLKGLLPGITSDLTINGPGAKALTVTQQRPTYTTNATPCSRLFTVYPGTHVAIAGLDLTGGNAGDAGQGGAVYNAGTLTLSAVAVERNGIGSQLLAYGAGGGGVYNSGDLTVVNCTFASNLVHLGYFADGLISGTGGAILNTGTAFIVGSEFDGNDAYAGAGIDNQGSMRLLNTTLDGNLHYLNPKFTPFTISVAGGVLNEGQFAAVACTIVNNPSLSNFGGFLTTPLPNHPAPSTTIVDCLLDDIYGPVASGSVGNLVRQVDPHAQTGLVNGVGRNQVGTLSKPINARLGNLANNGGPTFTVALLAGSPAAGAGVSFPGLTTDQRGVARPANRAPDIGAYQTGS